MALDPSTYFGALTVRRKLETMLAEIDALQAAVDALELGGGAVSAPAGEILFGNAGGDGVTSDAQLKGGSDITAGYILDVAAHPSALDGLTSIPAARVLNFLTADLAGGTAIGLVADAGATGAENVVSIVPLQAYSENYGVGNVTKISTFETDCDIEGTGTIADLAHVRIKSGVIGGDQTITNLYGLKIEDQTGGAVNKAIQTGLGLVDLGDDTSIDGDLAVTGNISAANFSTPLAEPTAPTVAVQGTPGSTVYHYQIVANNALGSTNAGKFSTTEDGAAAMDVTDFNRVTWVAVTGAVSYDVYRQKGADVIWKKIATALAAVTLDDTGIAGTTVEPPTVNTTAAVAAYAMKHAVRYLTDTQIKALPTTGVDVVTAPSAGKMLHFVSGLYTLDVAVGAYDLTPNASLSLVHSSDTGLAPPTNPTIFQSAMTDGLSIGKYVGLFVPATFPGFSSSPFEGYHMSLGAMALPESQPLIVRDMQAGVADYTGGHPANSLKVTVFYVEVDV